MRLSLRSVLFHALSQLLSWKSQARIRGTRLLSSPAQCRSLYPNSFDVRLFPPLQPPSMLRVLARAHRSYRGAPESPNEQRCFTLCSDTRSFCHTDWSDRYKWWRRRYRYLWWDTRKPCTTHGSLCCSRDSGFAAGRPAAWRDSQEGRYRRGRNKAGAKCIGPDESRRSTQEVHDGDICRRWDPGRAKLSVQV